MITFLTYISLTGISSGIEGDIVEGRGVGISILSMGSGYCSLLGLSMTGLSDWRCDSGSKIFM